MEELEELVRRLREERNLEYKSDQSWETLRAGIAKTALGMANLADGGIMIVGVAQARGFTATGVSTANVRTFSEDDVRSYIGARSDPPARVDLHTFMVDGMEFVAIQVHTFDRVPMIAREGRGTDIRRGAIYTRTMQPATVEVPDAYHMREILDLATERNLAAFVGTLRRAGLDLPQPAATAASTFEAELRGL